MSNPKERQGDFVFTAQEAGEYRVCFNNEMSTFAEKMVDFEIAVWLPLISPSRATLFAVSGTQLISSTLCAYSCRWAEGVELIH